MLHSSNENGEVKMTILCGQLYMVANKMNPTKHARFLSNGCNIELRSQSDIIARLQKYSKSPIPHRKWLGQNNSLYKCT